LSAPKAPPLDQELVKAACAQLPWEMRAEIQRNANDADLPEAKSSTLGSDDNNWQDGSLWANSRIRLVDLWVLPRDMSNGSDSRYADVASKSELRMLEQVPQLLRCPTVVAAAETALALGLPPAILRKEPALLVYPPEYIQGGMKTLKASLKNPPDSQVLKVCRDAPRLLLQTVEAYTEEQLEQSVSRDKTDGVAMETNQQLEVDVKRAHREFTSSEE
jgi:hypothetical protein